MPISDPTTPEGPALDIQVDDIIQVLARRNPGAARSVLERAGQIVTLVSDAVLNDADAIRRFTGLNEAGTLNVVHQIASDLGGRPDDDVRPILPVVTERHDLSTSFAETLIRERFVDKLRRRLLSSEMESWGVVQVDAMTPLHLLDIRTTGLLRIWA